MVATAADEVGPLVRALWEERRVDTVVQATTMPQASGSGTVEASA